MRAASSGEILRDRVAEIDKYAKRLGTKENEWENRLSEAVPGHPPPVRAVG